MSANNSTVPEGAGPDGPELWTEESWNASSLLPLALLGSALVDWNSTLGTALNNATGPTPVEPSASPGPAGFCDNWETAQHNLFQVANLFFCVAFLVPRHFKMSVLLFRFLLALGCLLTAVWAGFHVCAPDVFAWNVALLLVNLLHTAWLMVRFLPPALSPDLTELYLKVFRPLRVSKKAFKELAREANVLALEPGDTYAVEDCTPADERLSILLRGKLAVSCDGAHLHHIHSHQFVDSPEWEANHETSENTFQVTIAAEEESLYLCWQRMKLARVLRHRPQIRIVLETLIGKDITHKLYSLNEQLLGVGRAAQEARAASSDHWRGAMARSVSVDAVNTGTRGHVRSSAFKAARTRPRASREQREQRDERSTSLYETEDLLQSPVRTGQPQCWIPLVANHFPAMSPFTQAAQALHAAGAQGMAEMSALAGVPGMSGVPCVATVPPSLPPSSMALVPVPVIVPVLAPPPTLHQARSRSMRRAGAAGVAGGAGGTAVKFETPV